MHRREHRLVLVRAASTALIIGAVVAGFLLVIRDSDDTDSAAGRSGDAIAELPARLYPTLVPAGAHVFVYGGLPVSEGNGQQPALNDAALMDIESQTFEVLPEPPFPAGLTAPAAGVFTGDEVVLIGQLCESPVPDDPTGLCEPGTYAAAALSLERRTWREVPIPEPLQDIVNGDRRAIGATSDGRAVFLLGVVPQGRDARADRHVWTYTPQSDEWTRVPDPDSSLLNLCLAGDTVVAASSPFRDQDPNGSPQPNDESGTQPYLSLLDLAQPSAEWQRTEQAPVGAYVLTEPQVTCSDTGALVDDGIGRNTAFIPVSGEGSDWRPFPDVGDGTYLDVEWVGQAFVFLDLRSSVGGDQRSSALDPATGNSRDIEAVHVSVSDYVVSNGMLVGWRTSSRSGPLSTPTVLAPD